ncbi:MAG: SH3 domain-containing protein [Thermoguttaceae bacterium]
MHRFFILFLAFNVLWGSVSLVRGDPTFPYKAGIVADDVYVRSGPGQSYYPTDKLRRGQQVEVYRHDPGGWCAIRPIDGSFTWVSGRFLKPTENNLAVVTEDNVSARVGSRFSDVRDVVQVRLRKGEVVELLNPPSRGTSWTENAWFKIAPPSGEFRWVSAKYLDRDYPRDGMRKTPQEREFSGRGAAEDRAEPLDPSGPPRIPAAALGDGYAGESDREPMPRRGRARSLTPEEYEAELQRIELELSVMAAQTPDHWSFDAMRERTNQLLDQAQTAVERGHARLLANKIARFDDLKQRQEAVWALRDETDRDNRLYARLRPKDGDLLDATVELDGRFDGVGRLTQVVSPKRGTPRYALMDEAGKVRCYVTPTPGVNLRNYLGRQVGVTGTRGFMSEQHAGHIMARHVTPLEDTLMR